MTGNVREPTRVLVALAAGASSDIYNAGGDRVFVVATDLDEFEVSVDGGAFMPIGRGIAFAADNEFKRVRFKNPSAGPMTAEVLVSFWNYDDRRFHFPGSGAPVVVENDASKPVPTIEATPTIYSAGAATNINNGGHHDIAANAGRQLLIIFNGDAARTVWWRDQSATTDAGVPVGPKQTLVFAFAGASRVVNNSGGAVSVYVSEME